MKQCNCGSKSVTGGLILLEPYFFSVYVIRNRPKKIENHVSITISIHCFSIFMFIFKKVLAYYFTSPKITPNGYSLWMHLFFHDGPWVLISPYLTILSVDNSTYVVMRLVTKDDFFSSGRYLVKIQLANVLRLVWFVGLSSWVN